MAHARTAGYSEARGTNQDGDPLLTVAQTIGWLGCSRRTLYRLIEVGALVPTYIDSRPRFKSSDIGALIEAGRRPRTTEEVGCAAT